MRGTGEQRQFWGTVNMENEDFDFGEQGNKLIYFRGTRNNYLLGGPLKNMDV